MLRFGFRRATGVALVTLAAGTILTVAESPARADGTYVSDGNGTYVSDGNLDCTYYTVRQTDEAATCWAMLRAGTATLHVRCNFDWRDLSKTMYIPAHTQNWAWIYCWQGVHHAWITFP